MINIALFGPPGSGKGTQSALLCKTYNFTHIAPGNIFRAEVQKGTPLGRQLQSYIDQGHLVPEELTMEIIGRKIKEVAPPRALLLDGYPRSRAQVRALEKELKKLNKSLHLVLSLEVPQEELQRRIAARAQQEARTDDQSASILQRRLEIYHTHTLPVARHYAQEDKLVPIDGRGSMEEVQKRLTTAIERYAAGATS